MRSARRILSVSSQALHNVSLVSATAITRYYHPAHSRTAVAGRLSLSRHLATLFHVTYRIPSFRRGVLDCNGHRGLSSSSAVRSSDVATDDIDRPTGSLFATVDKPPIGPDLIGATGVIQRTFGPRSNAEGLLATGGAALAAHASFDPDYDRAQDWIRHHAVGPAVLSPILIAGLTGALTEAAFPHGVITAHSMRHHRPLIVGVTVASMIQVVAVKEVKELHASEEDADDSSNRDHKRKNGYNVSLRTLVTRVRDDAVIAEGTHELWVPDYLRM